MTCTEPDTPCENYCLEKPWKDSIPNLFNLLLLFKNSFNSTYYSITPLLKFHRAFENEITGDKHKLLNYIIHTKKTNKIKDEFSVENITIVCAAPTCFIGVETFIHL